MVTKRKRRRRKARRKVEINQFPVAQRCQKVDA
jgi:hypothetical protein